MPFGPLHVWDFKHKKLRHCVYFCAGKKTFMPVLFTMAKTWYKLPEKETCLRHNGMSRILWNDSTFHFKDIRKCGGGGDGKF